jgi:multidrug efflux pump subunit AcrA (membrane-fusion protein)
VRSRLERARAETEKLGSQKNILIKENRILEEQLEEGRLGYETKKAILEKEVRQLGLEMESTLHGMRADLEMSARMLAIKDGPGARESGQGEKGDLLVAEREGVVSELYFRNRGEFVRVSDLLCTILPGDSPLYVDITVANKDIGFIEQGMEMRYKFDAFPYTDYGTVQGRVSAISPSAVEDKALGFVYHINGTLDRTHFEVKGKRYPIKAGMTATAELITESKSIFSLIFRRLKQ